MLKYLEYRKRESRRQVAKLNEKTSRRELEREINNKGDFVCWKNNMKIL